MDDTKIEQSILGTIIQNPDLFARIYKKINNFHFLNESHRHIFEKIQECFEDHNEVDPLTVQLKCDKRKFRKISVEDFFYDLCSYSMSKNYLDEYCSMLIKRYKLNKLNELLSQVPTDEINEDNVDNILENISQETGSILHSGNTSSEIHEFKDSILSTAFEIRENFEKELPPGLTTHLESINDLFGSFKRTNLTVMAGVPGSAKCLGRGTMVRMYGGSVKPVEDIRVGDVLMGDDSTKRNVLSTCSGTEMLYKIKQENGDDYVVNESHILSLSSGWAKTDIPLTEYLRKPSAYKTYYRGYKAPVNYKLSGGAIDAYDIGMWLSGGKHNIEEAHLKLYDLTGAKYIPKSYMFSDYDTRYLLLSGFIDGVESVSIDYTNNYIELHNISNDVKNQIVSLCRSMGIYADIEDDSIILIHKNFKMLKSKNVKNSFFKDTFDKRYNTTDIVVEQLGFGEYFGFEIDGNRRFLLEDYTVTHNTGLAVDIGYNIAKLQGKNVLIFSLEMSTKQLIYRILSQETGIDLKKITEGKCVAMEIEEIERVCKIIDATPIKIIDKAGLNIRQIQSMAKFVDFELAKKGEKIDLIIIDYLQLMSPVNPKNNSTDVAVITEGTMGSKAMAKDLDCPVILLSQLNRGYYSSESRWPRVHNLKGSGSIEQDADEIVFVHRDILFLQAEKPDESDRQKYQEWLDKVDVMRDKAEIILAKNRHGPQGNTTIRFNAPTTSFSDIKTTNADDPFQIDHE